WLLYTSQTAGDQDGSVVKRRVSADGGRSFGPVETLCDVPGTFVRQPMVVNARGDWLLPLFRCIGVPGRRWTGDVDFASVLRSADGGRSWSAPGPTTLPNNNSSIQAIRRRSGEIAIVFNHASAATSSDRRASLYDEIDTSPPAASAAAASPGTRAAIWGVPRAPLSLAFSVDGGRSFAGQLDLETGSGYCLTNNSKDGLNREFSYPSIVEAPNGDLEIAFTYFRRAIKHVRLKRPTARPAA